MRRVGKEIPFACTCFQQRSERHARENGRRDPDENQQRDIEERNRRGDVAHRAIVSEPSLGSTERGEQQAVVLTTDEIVSRKRQRRQDDRKNDQVDGRHSCDHADNLYPTPQTVTITLSPPAAFSLRRNWLT